MKKLIFAAVALLTISATQAQKRATARFGLKGGLNVSTLAGDGVDATPAIGGHIGGLVDIKIANKFSIQPELLLSLQGAKSEYSYTTGGYSYSSEDKIALTYLNFPVIAKFWVLPNLSLEAGPQIGILVSAQDKYTEVENDGGVVTRVSRKESIKGGLTTAEAAFDLGASYYFTDNIFLTGRFCLGVSSIDKGGAIRVDNGNGNVYYYDGADLRNNVFQLSFGYRF